MATDCDSYFPFLSGAGRIVSEAMWEDYMGDALTDGVILKAANELAVFADSTGMQVKVPTGRARVRGHTGVLTSQKTLGIGANSSGQTRIDRVVIRLDVVAKKVLVDVVAGTPSGTPVAPALTQNSTTWEISLAQVTVPTGDTTIDAAQVTDERSFSRATDVEIGDGTWTMRSTPANSARIFPQGQTVSRVTYAALMAIAGMVAGPGDGVSTFQLPDTRGKTLVGRAAGDADFGTLGATPGTKAVTLTVAQMPQHAHGGLTGSQNALHWHTVAYRSVAAYGTDSAPVGGWANTQIWANIMSTNSGALTTVNTQTESAFHQHGIANDGGNAPHSVIQPSLVVNFEVRAR